MIPKQLYTRLLLLFSCLWLATAHGAFDGEFKSIGYDIEFYGESWGEVKQVEVEFSDVTVTPSNTFSMIAQGWHMDRILSDSQIYDGETRFINEYNIAFNSYEETEGGQLEQGSNMTFNVGEGTPLCFGSDTNTAIIIAPDVETDELDSELGLSLLIRKSSGMDASSLNGSYARYTIGNILHNEGRMDRITFDQATITFDGSGGYTENGTQWAVDRTISERVITSNGDILVDTFCTLAETTEQDFSTNGAYSVTDGGILQILTSNGMTSNQISPDSNVIASSFHVAQSNLFAAAFFTVMVKTPANWTSSTIDAVYYIGSIEEEFSRGFETESINNNSVDLERIYVFLKSDGTFSMRDDNWESINILNNAWSDFDDGPATNLVSKNQVTTLINERRIEISSNTYSIAANGIITLNFSNGEMGMAQISENGEFIIFGHSNADEDEAGRQLGIGIRRTPPTPSTTPVTFNSATMSPSGLVINVTLPPNYPVEGIFCTDLVNGEWLSGGEFLSESGDFEFTDASITNEATGFYSATFMPW